MGSMRSALNELEEEITEALEVNKRLGLRQGDKFTYSGEVYFAGKTWQVKNEEVTATDILYPNTAEITLEDGSIGFVSKEDLVKGTLELEDACQD